MALSDSIISAESGGDPNAQNPNSSAAGAGQFINSTWLDLVKQYRPDLADGKSDADILAMRSDPTLSQQMVGAYADQNSKVLSNNGFQATPGNLYLAHFAGPQGAVNLLNADPNASAASVMGPQAAAANPFLRNMTVGQLRSWAAGKVGGGTASPSAPAPVTAPQGGTGGITAPMPAAPSAAPPTTPPQAAAAAPAPSLGLLNDPGALMSAAPQSAPAPAATQSAMPAAPRLQPPPQLPQGTPAAAALRQRLLASILSPQGNPQ